MIFFFMSVESYVIKTLPEHFNKSWTTNDWIHNDCRYGFVTTHNLVDGMWANYRYIIIIIKIENRTVVRFTHDCRPAEKDIKCYEL